MNCLTKNIQTITIGVLIMVVWVSLWFIIDLYLSVLYKKHGILLAYLCLFVASSIGKTSIGKVSRAGLPFLAVSLLVLVLVSLFPELSLFLPKLIMN